MHVMRVAHDRLDDQMKLYLCIIYLFALALRYFLADDTYRGIYEAQLLLL